MKIVNVDGGIGRCIAFTGALREPVDVITTYPGLFFNHPLVRRVYPPSTPYLYDRIKEADYLHPEPYNLPAYYRDEKHLVSCFSLILNGDDQFAYPEIHLTENEKAVARSKVSKKTALFQPFGSQVGGARALSLAYAQRIVDRLTADGFEVVLVENKPCGLKGVKYVNATPREIIAMVPFVGKLVGIDSFLQHAAAALKVPMTVFWASTLPEQLGYDIHTNIPPVTRPTVVIPNRLPHNILNAESLGVPCDESDANLDKACSTDSCQASPAQAVRS